MTLEDAKTVIQQGVEYGLVYPLVPEQDRGSLRKWYLETPSVPNIQAREQAETTTTVVNRPKFSTYINLNPCTKCGASEFVPGACPTCANCGESSGGCG